MTQPLDGLGDADLQGRLEKGMAAVERCLLATARQDDPLIGPAVSHLLRAGGKRMRPLLTLLAAELGDPASPGVVEAAAAVELTHLASLYHDDILDDAELRRGVPAAHVQYGPSVAILAGDWLFARASALVAELGPQCVRIQAEAFARLCEGQIRETSGAGATDDLIGRHLGVLADKTGALIATSAHLGALLSGASENLVAAVVAFGEKVGVAFQLADDVLDLEADPELSGKIPGTDLRERVATMPLLLLRARADEDRACGLETSDAIVLERDIDGDLDDDARLGDVVARLTASPALEEARAVALSWADDAVAELSDLAEGPVRSALEAFARHAVHRIG